MVGIREFLGLLQQVGVLQVLPDPSLGAGSVWGQSPSPEQPSLLQLRVAHGGLPFPRMVLTLLQLPGWVKSLCLALVPPRQVKGI